MFTLCLVMVLAASTATGEQRALGYGGAAGGAGGRLVSDQRTSNGYGDYAFSYETSDGTRRTETGSQNDGQNTKGSWRYTSPEGTPVDISFVADQGGYQPQGAVLPVAPNLPYQRSQQFIH